MNEGCSTFAKASERVIRYGDQQKRKTTKIQVIMMVIFFSNPKQTKKKEKENLKKHGLKIKKNQEHACEDLSSVTGGIFVSQSEPNIYIFTL